MAGLSSRLSKLKPFPKSGGTDEEEDEFGEEIESNTIAGGGHGARVTGITQHQLRVSHALRSFLVNEGALSAEEAGLDNLDQTTAALHSLVEKPHINVPSWVTDRSHPLPEYFISSSHNTYLLAHQLYGTSCASAYETALKAGARCIEIDAWDYDDNKDEPKVTHGFTLVSNIPFRAVCETIRDVVDAEAAEAASEQGYRAAPILLSLENHCGPYGQLRLVQIMKEVFGSRLLSEAVRQKGHEGQVGSGDHICLSDLGSKIVVIVEYHFPNEAQSSDDSDTSSSEGEEEEEKQARKTYRAKKNEASVSTTIIPELAELGVYAQSVKPQNNSWYEEATKSDSLPHHHLINVSESGLAAHLPSASAKIARHNAKHLMRVYPKGTRISSKNLHPVPFWRVGAQICALNWQTFGAAMQLNEALFSGTDGYVRKPPALRADGAVLPKRKLRLRLRVAGATDIPLPAGRDQDEIKPYLSCVLMHPGTHGDDEKKKTSPYRRHKLTGLFRSGEGNPANTDPLWNERLEWEYEDDGSEMVFLRMLVKSDDAFARNPVLAVTAVRVLYVVKGEWRFVRMLDLKGRETRAGLLVKFEVEGV